MKEVVKVTFACGHEGEVETDTTLSLTYPPRESTSPVDEDIVQFVIFRNNIKCPSCDSAVWKETSA